MMDICSGNSKRIKQSVISMTHRQLQTFQGIVRTQQNWMEKWDRCS